jgi:glutaredoxin 2
MKLYMFEHCSLCFRVRMAAALKGLHLQEVPVLDDDTETMTKLAGKRAVPILVKNNGEPMLESMDMVKYIEAQGEPLFTGSERPEIAAWAEAVIKRTAPLTMPRYPLLGLPEFGTVAALSHYQVRKRKVLGDLTGLLAQTRTLISELMPDLEALDRMIESPAAVNGVLSLDDIRVLPLLRSAAAVKALQFPSRVRAYFETMMGRTGYAPLPAI